MFMFNEKINLSIDMQFGKFSNYISVLWLQLQVNVIVSMYQVART